MVRGRPVDGCHDKYVGCYEYNHGVEVPIAEGVGKQDKGKEPGRDLTDAVNQEKRPTNRVYSKTKSPSFLEGLVAIDGPGKTQTRGENCPELQFWNVGKEVGDVHLQEGTVVVAHQVGEEEIELEEGLEGRLAADFNHPSS